MIDPKNRIIRRLVDEGYTVAAHAYLRPNGRVNYTFAVKHAKSGKVVQGWSAGGDASDALRDLARRAGFSADEG